MTDAPEALPPEINSGLVHGGVGPLSMEQAALAFAEAAVTDQANAQVLSSLMAAVRDQWEGDTADAYASSLQPFITWFEDLAINGAASAEQIQAAAASIAQAIGSAPHPTLVTENRTTWGVLAATNFFGVNTPAMNVQDDHYLEMWFQAAFARATSDIETEVATTSLKPFEPPTIPVNLGAFGSSPAIAAALAGFAAPQGAANAADLVASQAGWTTTLAAGVAGDGAGMAGTKPNASLASAAKSDAQSATDNNKDSLQNSAQQGSEQMSQLTSQAGSMAGQAGQLPQEVIQGLTQPIQQVGQVPQQFSSILQPLMQSAGLNHGLSGLSDGATAAPLMPMNFATGSGSLAAAVTRPASGIGGVGGSGLRLPGSSLAAAAEPETAASTAARLAAAESGATPAGPGFIGTPRTAQTGRRDGSANKYETHTLGIDNERAS